MKLTICIPTIPERIEKLQGLLNELDTQIKFNSLENEVEVIALMDNKKITIGEKRDRLLKMAGGKYVSFIDDDDWIGGMYVKELCDAIDGYNVDVITFKQQCFINGEPFEVNFNGTKDQPASKKDGKWINIMRRPYHVCAWRTELARQYSFPFVSYGEDGGWVDLAYQSLRSRYHIDKLLHVYRWDENVTAASTDDNKIWKNPNHKR